MYDYKNWKDKTAATLDTRKDTVTHGIVLRFSKCPVTNSKIEKNTEANCNTAKQLRKTTGCSNTIKIPCESGGNISLYFWESEHFENKYYNASKRNAHSLPICEIYKLSVQ